MHNEKLINMKFYLVYEKQIVFIPQCYTTAVMFFPLKHNVDHKIIHKVNPGYHLSILFSDIENTYLTCKMYPLGRKIMHSVIIFNIIFSPAAKK